MAKKKKTSASARQKQKNQSKKQLIKIMIGAAAAVLAVAAVVLFVVQAHRSSAEHALRGTQWVSQSAKTASGDEVDIRQVYNVKYSQYQGRLTFDDQNHFELWLHPGDASDGTHTGTYELKEDKLTAVFDEGTVADFSLMRSDGNVVQIEVPYDDYIVSFVREKK